MTQSRTTLVPCVNEMVKVVKRDSQRGNNNENALLPRD